MRSGPQLIRKSAGWLILGCASSAAAALLSRLHRLTGLGIDGERIGGRDDLVFVIVSVTVSAVVPLVRARDETNKH